MSLLENALAILPIERRYYDVWGREQFVTEERVRGILRALRFRLDTDEECLTELIDFQQARAAREVRPVYVLRRSERRLYLHEIGNKSADWRIVSESGEQFDGRLSEGWLEIPGELELGYHELRVSIFHSKLICVPEKAYSDSIAGKKIWGISSQLYSLHSAQSEGVGDFCDLKALYDWTLKQGGSFVGVNPLHALFPNDNLGYSPYSPSSRRALNPLYIRVAEVPEVQNFELSFEPDSLIDYSVVAQRKLSALRDGFKAGLSSHRAEEFRKFRAGVDGHTINLALHSAILSLGIPHRLSEGVGLAIDAELERERDFQLYLQWIAHTQLQDSAAGGLGLYLDLAVGVNPAGAEVWEDSRLFAVKASAGAPPDLLNVLGQVWGLAPYIPWELEDRAYTPFIETLRFNMKYAGALRIDHIMALQRTFWVPEGMNGGEGVYLRYPLQDLLGIVALESVRNQCVVIGEDLGTVPDEIRVEMGKREILSYKVLYFMKHYAGDQSFIAPAEYPEKALVTASTHDLPTLRGFFEGRDLEVRRPLGLYSENCTYEGEIENRALDLQRLRELVEREFSATQPDLLLQLQKVLAKSPSCMHVVQLEDLLNELDQANLPGTVTEHPNWRRRLGKSLEQILSSENLDNSLQQICSERPDKII